MRTRHAPGCSCCEFPVTPVKPNGIFWGAVGLTRETNQSVTVQATITCEPYDSENFEIESGTIFSLGGFKNFSQSEGNNSVLTFPQGTHPADFIVSWAGSSPSNQAIVGPLPPGTHGTIGVNNKGTSCTLELTAGVDPDLGSPSAREFLEALSAGKTLSLDSMTASYSFSGNPIGNMSWVGPLLELEDYCSSQNPSVVPSTRTVTIQNVGGGGGFGSPSQEELDETFGAPGAFNLTVYRSGSVRNNANQTYFGAKRLEGAPYTVWVLVWWSGGPGENASQVEVWLTNGDSNSRVGGFRIVAVSDPPQACVLDFSGVVFDPDFLSNPADITIA